MELFPGLGLIVIQTVSVSAAHQIEPRHLKLPVFGSSGCH